jgi:hypothetical protein
MSNAISTVAAIATIGNNNPPDAIGIADNIDVKRMFERASKDSSQSIKLANTAETRSAIAALAFYHKTNFDKMTVGTMWKLDRRIGGDWEHVRFNAFREELRSACGLVKPKLSAGGIVNDKHSALVDEYNREDKLLTRGMELAFDMLMTPTVETRRTAEQVLAYFDDKRGMFVVPFEMLLKRDQIATGELGLKAYGRGTPDHKSYIAPTDDFRVALDGGKYSASKDGVDDLFFANTARVKLCAESFRVDVKTVTVTDAVTGVETTTEVVTPIEAAGGRMTAKKAEAARVAGIGKDSATTSPSTSGNVSAGRPEGSASTPSGVSFETAMRTLLEVTSEPVADTGVDAYWSNYPYAAQVDNLITALTAMKAGMIAYEATHRAEIANKAKDQEANRARVANERKVAGKSELTATSEQRKA